ncbi:MAG: DNA polymerase ligase N-terminal domain-containing protein [Ignavibacteriaceae bacterium]
MKPNLVNRPLMFVVKKHHASHLHYDFRLELNGVLVSWFLLEGPSLNPKKEAIAQMTEIHKIKNKYSEGVIPKGRYGAGPFIVWDMGIYLVEGCNDRKESEMKIKEGLLNGEIDFILKGKKLKGKFKLKLIPNEENKWFLIKQEDDFASSKNILLKDRSVISNKTIEEIGIKKKSRKNNKNLEQLNLFE